MYLDKVLTPLDDTIHHFIMSPSDLAIVGILYYDQADFTTPVLSRNR